jgi:hypothetical protein
MMYLPILYAVRSAVDHLLDVLMREQLKNQGHIVRIQKQLGQIFKLEHIWDSSVSRTKHPACLRTNTRHGELTRNTKPLQ